MIHHATKKIFFVVAQQSSFQKLTCVLCLFVFTFVFQFISFSVHAQSSVIHLFSLTPDWNHGTFCGAGNGYDPSRITAPSVSYSGKNTEEPSYEYYWEQKKNDEEWTIVTAAKQAKFIPSYDPPALFNDKPGAKPIQYSFRLRVIDHANGNQTEMTDEFSLTIVAGPLATYKLIPVKGTSKSDIDLTITGGLADKKYDWSNEKNAEEFPSAMLHVEDPEGLKPGSYLVRINDGGCPELTKQIIIPGK